MQLSSAGASVPAAGWDLSVGFMTSARAAVQSERAQLRFLISCCYSCPIRAPRSSWGKQQRLTQRPPQSLTAGWLSSWEKRSTWQLTDGQDGMKIHKLDVNAAERRLDAVAKMLIRPGVVHTCQRVISCFHPFTLFPGQKRVVANLTKPKRLCCADDLFLSPTVVTLTPAPFLHTCDLRPPASSLPLPRCFLFLLHLQDLPLFSRCSDCQCSPLIKDFCYCCSVAFPLLAVEMTPFLPGCGQGYGSLLSAFPFKMILWIFLLIM